MKRTVEDTEVLLENKSSKNDDESSSSSGAVQANGNNLLRNETEFLVQSNLLRLQTEELVNEVQGSVSSPSIEKCIEKIKTCLMASSSSSSSSWLPEEEINATWLRSKGIKGLDFTNYGEVEQVLSYEKPIAISVVGKNEVYFLFISFQSPAFHYFLQAILEFLIVYVHLLVTIFLINFCR